MYRRNEADHETYTAEHGQKEEGKREYGEGWKIKPRQQSRSRRKISVEMQSPLTEKK